MHYDPVDVPLAWTARGELVVAHREVYNNGDVYVGSCTGSGFYAVPVAGGVARALSVGGVACSGIGEGRAAVNAAGDWAVFSEYAYPDSLRLSRLNFGTGRMDTVPTECRVELESPSISADARRIAAVGWCRDRQRDSSALYTLNIDGSGLRQIADGPGTASWSPDGQRLAVSLDSGIVVMAADGTQRRVITTGGDASWSPDGAWIAFFDSMPGNPEAAGIFVARPDGSGRREVFRNRMRSTYERGWGPIREGEPEHGLVWSPDSRWIAFARTFDRGTSIWRVEVESGRVEQVTRAAR
jgi:Tol biopolymer transport system component